MEIKATDIGESNIENLRNLFSFVYPTKEFAWFFSSIKNSMNTHRQAIDANRSAVRESQINLRGRYVFCEEDVLLIAYPDAIRSKHKTPLATLNWFLNTYLKSTFSMIHLLPFYPYSSDDGFSVIDYRKVNQETGSWEDVSALAKNSRLMFDAVINHISSQSNWFKGYIRGKGSYSDFFIEKDTEGDYSMIVRPRTSPLFTSFQTQRGIKEIWTTFSPDQIDLNYKNPQVLLEVIDTLLAYVGHGASLIRLDAINYLWKQVGTTSSNLPQCHAVIRIIRLVLDIVCPWVVLVSETNIPHIHNISYFGDGYNEAQIIYQFSLPPLVVHSFLSKEMNSLGTWLRTLQFNGSTTYLNFLASHDGVGVVPATGILMESEIEALAALSLQRGGRVNYKTTPEGKNQYYELNCTFHDLICDPEDDPEINIDKFIGAQSILLALRGVPAIYFNTLFGDINHHEGVANTGIARSINRRKYHKDELERFLKDNGREKIIFTRLKHLIETRKQHSAFSPHAEQEVLKMPPAILGLLRHDVGRERVLVLVNASDGSVPCTVDPSVCDEHHTLELIAGHGTLYHNSDVLTVTIPAYGFSWWKVVAHDA